MPIPTALPARQETYTTQQPDGTVVTTTTQVRTKYEETEYGCGMGTLNDRYCCKPAGIVRIIEIVVGLIIVSLISSVFGPGPFKNILIGQTFLMLFTGVAFCFTFIFLLVYFFNMHVTHLSFWPWNVSDLIFSTVAAITFVVLGLLEAYYATGAWSNNCNDIGGDGIIHNGCRFIYEWAFASFFCFVNAILYAISAVLARRERQYE